MNTTLNAITALHKPVERFINKSPKKFNNKLKIFVTFLQDSINNLIYFYKNKLHVTWQDDGDITIQEALEWLYNGRIKPALKRK